MTMSLLLCIAMQALSVAAHPLSTQEPTIVTKLAVSTGTPFEMPTPTLTASAPLQARQWEWTPSAPVWTPVVQPPTPAATILPPPTPIWVPTPTPSYTWAETHNDDKNTLAHGIIAAIVIGLFLGVGFVGCLIFTMYRQCCGGRVRNQGTKCRARDVEAGGDGQGLRTGDVAMQEVDDLTSAEHHPPMVAREVLGRTGDGRRGAGLDPVHYKRG
jgi:hypothetical protein